MAISDAEYQAWLSDDEVKRLILAEIKTYSGGAEVTRYVGSDYFHTGASDTPSNTNYEGVLTGSPSFTSRMSEAFSGRSFVAFGSLSFDNSDGGLDDWIEDSFAGREVLIKLGDPSWNISDFRTIIHGVADRLIVQSDSELELIIRDKQRLLDGPVQTSLISSGPNKGKPVPLCYGDCKNVHAVLIDETTHEYQVHEGTINGITQVYVNGKATSLTVTHDPANGKFTLNADPKGEVTCDVEGDSTGSYTDNLSDIIERLVTRVIPSVDATSKANFTTDAPYSAGVYIKDRENLLDVLDSLIPGWYYGFDRDGNFIYSLMKEPGTPTAEIDSLETYGQIELVKADVPSWRQRIGYEKNHTILNSVDEHLTGNEREFLEEHFKNVETYEDSSVKTEHLTAQDPEFRGTVISNSTDAQTEAQRVQTLYGTQRFLYRVQAFTAPYQITIGDTVTLIDHRYGLSSGKDCVVVGITEYLLDNKIELEVWR